MNLLQVDVVIGAVFSGLFAARMMQIALPMSYWIVLALSVWIMYTADHLVDAYRLKEQSQSRRHRWVFRHFHWLFILTVLFFMIDVVLVIVFLGKDILIFGMALGFVGLLYFYQLHRTGGKNSLVLQKELVVAVIYSVGIWGAPVLLSAFPFQIYHLYMLVIFLLLAIAGVMILSYFDASDDEADRHPTIAVKFGSYQTRRSLSVLGILAAFLALFLFVAYPNPVVMNAAFIYNLMAIAILMLLRYSDNLRQHERFRYLTEMVFWIPGLILLI